MYIYIYVYDGNTHVITHKISIKINVATDEGNGRNKIWHWTKETVRSDTVQIWLLAWIELKAWYLSRLERLNRIQWSWVQIPLRPTFYNYF